jgi:hypothetical protein
MKNMRSEKDTLQKSNDNKARQRKACFVYLQAEGVEIPESWLSPADELQSTEEMSSAALSNSKRLNRFSQKTDARNLRQSKMVSVSNGTDDHIDLLSSPSKSDLFETLDETAIRAAMYAYSSAENVNINSEYVELVESGTHLLPEVQTMTSPTSNFERATTGSEPHGHTGVGADSLASLGSECNGSVAQQRLASSPASGPLATQRNADRHLVSAAVSANDYLSHGAPSAALDIASEGLPPALHDEAEEDRNPLCAAMPATCTAGPPPSSPRVVLVQSVAFPPNGGAEHEATAPSFTAAILDSASAMTALADAAAGAMAAAGAQAAAAFPPWLADLLGGPAAMDPAGCAVWRDADWAAGAGTLFLDGVALRVQEGTVHLDGVAVAEPVEPARPALMDPAHGLLRCPCARRLLIACAPKDSDSGSQAAEAAEAAAAEWATVCRDCGRWIAGPAAAERDVEVLF